MPKSAGRVLDIFELISRFPKGLAFTEIHEKLGIPKSSLNALLRELTARSYVEKDGINRYVPSIRLMALGTIHVGANDLVESADPVMAELRDLTQETVNLAVLDQGDIIFIHKKLAPQPLRYDIQVGRRFPAYASAVGKAMLSTLEDEEVRALYPNDELVGFTPNTLRTIEELLAKFNEIRQRGLATDHEEGLIGVYAVASPILDQTSQVVAAISIAYPKVRYTIEFEKKLTESVITGAQMISASLGLLVVETIPSLRNLRDIWGA